MAEKFQLVVWKNALSLDPNAGPKVFPLGAQQRAACRLHSLTLAEVRHANNHDDKIVNTNTNTNIQRPRQALPVIHTVL